MVQLKRPQGQVAAAERNEFDHLDWVAGFSFLAYGVRIGVRTNDAPVIEKLLPHLPPGWKITEAAVARRYSIVTRSSSQRHADSLHELYANAEKLGGNARLAPLLDFFESDVQLYIAEHAPRRVFVHAGVVGWQGKAIVIPGRSYTGKTTLVAALVKAGATYYSDEYAVFDKRGMVHPYARRLGIRSGRTRVRTQKYAVEELGGKSGSTALPVGLVMVSKYREGARFKPLEISAGASVLALLQNTVSARRNPQMVLPTLKNALATARSFKSVRGDAGECVEAIFRACAWPD
ncbi:MAG: hypothetical protein HY231_16030 [Acidobacteria bacterium]|nr:hypothetical protein [Acidobacteriota bacterium]